MITHIPHQRTPLETQVFLPQEQAINKLQRCGILTPWRPPKDSCWHDWPFDADLVLRKTGARRLGDPKLPLVLLALLAREQGHEVQLYQRNARLEAQSVSSTGQASQQYQKEQAQLALGIGDRLFMLSSARSWDEELIIAHRRMATGTLVKWPANQGNDMVQLVRRQYTLSMGRLLFHSDSYDNGESLLVQSAQQRSRLTATLSKNLTPRNFGFPDDVHAILRLTHLQHLDDHLPAAQARPKARL